MQTTDPRYDHLSDPAEREWLTNLSPSDVASNAHRFYDFMRESGIPADSYTREMAFKKAAEELGVPYDTLYNAWLNEQPVAGRPPHMVEDIPPAALTYAEIKALAVTGPEKPRRWRITWKVTERHEVVLDEGDLREVFAVPAGRAIDREALGPRDGSDPLGGIEGDEYATYRCIEDRVLVELCEVTEGVGG